MDNLIRDNLAMEIARELLDNDILDENNFSYDTAAILEYRVCKINCVKLHRLGSF